jgi:AbiV family abortive infection protein
MARRPDPTIPRHALREGIVDCLTVASRRLHETDTLLEQGLPTQAGIVFSFAVEEFGKAALLRRAAELGADPALIEGFYDHRDKIEAAAQHVAARFLRLTAGEFDAGAFDSEAFDTGRPADLAARMSGLYVDWRGRWVHGLHVDGVTLRQSSQGLQLAIQKAMIDWT